MQQNNTSGEVSVLTVIGIVLVILKLVNVQPVASWSWIWITCPFWIPFLVLIVILLIMLIALLYQYGKR